MRLAKIAAIPLVVILLLSVVGCKAEYSLSVSVASGQGVVTPSSGTYTDGTTVTIAAIPDSGWEFSHWSGSISGSENPYTIRMKSNKTIGAYFVQTQLPAPTPTPTSIPTPTPTPTLMPTPTPTPTPSDTYSYFWSTGAWGVCSATCGGGVQTRPVFCTRTDIVAVVDDSYCPSSPKPATSQACNTEACPTPTPTPTPEPTAQAPTHQ